ncbi:nuclease domain-containing protein [Pseudacidovorax intermedius]|uniref:nuclease domain-containing protein n=1 Tax=Pseudacidovorax intermedius TaxID=433924 RepID=UPI00034BAA1F|nr:nuclease domain-containing protein [Pseudacidovorax intermedius]
MKRSAPLQRTGWKRQDQPKGEERPERIPPVVKPLTRPPVYWKPANEPVLAMPKTVAHRNRALLDLARDSPCLLRIPGRCNGDPKTTVSAHANLHEAGKAGARKADDEYSVWACARCHTWLDSSYSATFEEKAEAFAVGHARQRIAWQAIAEDPQRSESDRRAARWALDHLAGN